MRQYVGLIHNDEASDFGVSFPDFPGVVTAGKSLRESLELAEDALTFHVEGMIEDGQPIPSRRRSSALRQIRTMATTLPYLFA
ncbi:MAG: hypothetical protein E5V52_06735 [Mesorhizobium sp.]|uniref:type II toxin-antitoxin system HicB family antitoxin n=1 Tax=Mesorhizobium sp. M2A.F.Ca.ET.067.02.1.1 TaxID=2496749 RepID=UPI000FD3488A|nr:type II toxin-antitoxin system HicB family antitoxin [Mesorhizobium sp. M2A.F.Ca.ET.067.02.1.1]RUW80170.1 hypothetical protein EOA28_05715 [Mesorhizobium sp. M2A.F.Ca.ET.067.02.1.1]TIU58577.1 MAG: hypothetical protein E5W35_03560 [Mesorhizobium sp.]TIW86179.1 MAG: hypothetical protein E5V52_06735 [Mesorhizobium sp.]